MSSEARFTAMANKDYCQYHFYLPLLQQSDEGHTRHDMPTNSTVIVSFLFEYNGSQLLLTLSVRYNACVYNKTRSY